MVFWTSFTVRLSNCLEKFSILSTNQYGINIYCLITYIGIGLEVLLKNGPKAISIINYKMYKYHLPIHKNYTKLLFKFIKSENWRTSWIGAFISFTIFIWKKFDKKHDSSNICYFADGTSLFISDKNFLFKDAINALISGFKKINLQ